MDYPADQTNQPSVMNAVDLQSPDRKVVRRRFVQSTLFPLKSHDTKAESSIKKEVKKVEEIADDDNEEEFCGSQGGKRKGGRKLKGNTTPQKRRSKKVNDTKLEDFIQKEGKIVEEIADGEDDEEFCRSQGGKRKRGRKTKGNSTPHKRGSKKAAVNGNDASVVAIDDDTESPDYGSPQQLKAKQRVSTRNGRTNSNKAISMSEVSTHPVATQQSSQLVPDLWLEAKKTAEENSRIFAGKQMHPFFTSWKAGKKDLEIIEVENNGCLDKRKERIVELGLVHVFENVKDDLDSIDWSNWTFDDGIFSKTTWNEERQSSSFEGTIGSLNFDDILSGSNLLKNVSLTEVCGSNENSSVILTSVSSVVVDDEVKLNDPFQNIEKDLEVSEVCIHGTAGFMSSHFEQKHAIPLESIMSHYLNRGNYPENSLWADKYHPEKASEVCGNSEAVKFMNDWLQHWHASDFRLSKSSYSADKCSVKDNEYGSSDNDSDAENVEASGLKNVLLVTGPVGSGKSAAIYACAEEQGFQVIEVNASDWRNGALLKQKFGEAVGSHWLKRSQESPNKLNFKSSPVFTNKAAAQDLNDGVVEVVSLLEEEDYVGAVGRQNHRNGRLSCDKGDIKTLILFEDVDVILCDDRGFISTIQHLADTGKRPMILTSNNESPLLPDNLDREEVCFTMPSVKELAHHIYLVCSAEKADIQPDLIERCVEFCRGDIRKTLMHLQFWCQSKEGVTDGNMQRISCPLTFNLEAGHCILPKLIPWELPSLLSEFVEAQVAKSVSRMEESHSLLGVVKEEEESNINIENKLDLDIGETASIEAKKEAILSGNCFLHVDNDIILGNNTCEFSNSSGSPVAFTRRNNRRKLDAVLSDSEDEICNHGNVAVTESLTNDDSNALIPAVHSQFPVVHSALVGISKVFGTELLHSEAMEVESAGHQSAETAHVNHINFFAVGTSCNQSTDLIELSAEAKYQHLEFVHANCSNYEEAHDSLSLFNYQLVQTGDGNLVANMHQSSLVNHQFGNQFADQPNIGTRDASILCLNPSSDQVQQCGETKTGVQRILFPHPAHADPVSGAIGSPRIQSTGQLIPCMEASVVEPQHCHLVMGDVNHDRPVATDASLNPVFGQLLSCGQANMENSEQQFGETGNANPLCYTALGDSLNPSNGQLFHFVEGKEKEILHQHTEADDRYRKSCAAVDGPLNQLRDQFIGIAKQEKSQQQHPHIADANYTSSLQQDGRLKLMSEQLHSQEEKPESVQDQLPDMATFDLVSCPEVNNSMNPLDGKILKFFQTKAEEHQCQYSDATNANHVIDHCQSVDLSYVPESTFVPETEVNDGTECLSGADLTEIVSPVTIDLVNPLILGHEASEYRLCDIDLNVNANDEEMADSQSENDHLEPSTSGCPVMDECSRIDFCKRFKSFRSSALNVKNLVQETWNELRLSDLGQYVVSEHKNALQVLELGYRMSNLMSEGDRLFHDSEFLINDPLSQETGLSEETYTFGCHDQQVQMAFSIAQYGYSLYAKDIYVLQSNMGQANKLHLGWEMLVSTSNSLALGKLLSLNRSKISSTDTTIKQAATTVDTSFTRERTMCLQNIVESVVPLKSYLTVRGNALLDYLSSLAHISRSETARLAETAEKTKRRRVRVAKNYLSSGGLDLSQDDILKLNEYNSYRRYSSNSRHETSNFR